MHKCHLYEKAFRRNPSPKNHLKAHCDDKFGRTKLCQSIVLSKTERFDNDGSELSTAETTEEFSSKQNNTPKPVGKQLSADDSKNNADIKHFMLTSYGCGMCDEMFEIEQKFLGHCDHHFCENPQEDTFLKLFEVRLLSYSP